MAAPMTLSVGDVQISRIEELYGPTFPIDTLLPSFDAGGVEHLPVAKREQFVQQSDQFAKMSIHAWMIRTPSGKVILVDTCNGNHKKRAMEGFGDLDLPWLDTLAAAGVTPDQVTDVVCTHLHLDHVGWNTMLVDGEWVPTFPNATVHMNQVEFDFWNPANVPAGLEFNGGVFEDSVQPCFDRGQVNLWNGDGLDVDDTLHLQMATGHTPGQCIGVLESKGERAVFAGDTMHSPYQVYHPEWFCGFDLVPAEAEATRRKVLELCVEKNAILMPAHFSAPHAYRVSAEGNAFSVSNAL